jgi:hypothetical protein
LWNRGTWIESGHDKKMVSLPRGQAGNIMILYEKILEESGR